MLIFVRSVLPVLVCQELSIFIFLAQTHFKSTKRTLREHSERIQRALRGHLENTKRSLRYLVIREQSDCVIPLEPKIPSLMCPCW